MSDKFLKKVDTTTTDIFNPYVQYCFEGLEVTSPTKLIIKSF